MDTEVIKINKLELASELAHDATKDEMFAKGLIVSEDEMFIGDAGIQNYTDEAQDIFNDYYEYYLEKIEGCGQQMPQTDEITKEGMIKRIKSIIGKYGIFGITEVDADSIHINEIRGLISLGEFFNVDTIRVNVYRRNTTVPIYDYVLTTEPISDYVLTYEELSDDNLKDILFVAELYETDQEKTLKRIGK